MHMKKSVYFAVVYECTPQFAAPLEQKYIDQKLVLRHRETNGTVF